MKKQIEQMMQDHCVYYGQCSECPVYPKSWDPYGACFIACKMLYKAGYRKQSEGEWKQTTEPLGAHDVDCVECSSCGESWVLDEDFDYDVVKDFWNFCPNCGARMKGQ